MRDAKCLRPTCAAHSAPYQLHLPVTTFRRDSGGEVLDGSVSSISDHRLPSPDESADTGSSSHVAGDIHTRHQLQHAIVGDAVATHQKPARRCQLTARGNEQRSGGSRCQDPPRCAAVHLDSAAHRCRWLLGFAFAKPRRVLGTEPTVCNIRSDGRLQTSPANWHQTRICRKCCSTPHNERAESASARASSIVAGELEIAVYELDSVRLDSSK